MDKHKLRQTEKLLHSKGYDQQKEKCNFWEWEKIIETHRSDKELISKIHKEQLNNKQKIETNKQNCPIRKWGKDLHGYFSKEDI